MLSKNNRVTKDTFQKIMKDGLFLSGSIFTFRYLRAKSLNCAFVAPKSVSKKAVTRNKLRRQGYSALRSIPPSSLKPLACIFFYKKQAKDVLFEDIKKDVSNILSKVK